VERKTFQFRQEVGGVGNLFGHRRLARRSNEIQRLVQAGRRDGENLGGGLGDADHVLELGL
jgi:hypothetical protein